MKMICEEKFIDDQIKKLRNDIKRMQNFKGYNWDFCLPLPLDDFTRQSRDLFLGHNEIGVYIIWHVGKTKDIPLYVGEGVISKRVNRHKKVFINGGKDLSHGASTSTSPVGRKMFNYDSDISKWAVSYSTTNCKQMASLLESSVYAKLQPYFNSISSLSYMMNG